MDKKVTLKEIGVRHGVDKNYHTNLLDQYEELLPKKCKIFLEIGCLYGNSAMMFKEWYGEKTQYHLLDIFSEVSDGEMTSRGFFTYKGSQDDLSLLSKLPSGISIVSEDASHHSDQQIVTFKYIFKEKLAKGGLYIIEDCYGHFEDYWRRNIIQKPEETILPLMEKLNKGEDITSQFFTQDESDYFKANIAKIEIKDNIHCFIWKK